MLDEAFVCLCLAVVVDAYEEEVGGMLRYLGGVLPVVDLRDGAVNVAVVFQFEDDGG